MRNGQKNSPIIPNVLELLFFVSAIRSPVAFLLFIRIFRIPRATAGYKQKTQMIDSIETKPEKTKWRERKK